MIRLLGTFPLALAVSTLALATARAEPARLTIVHFNDLDRMEEDEGAGGVARLATVVKAARDEHTHLLVTFAGDAISPSLLSGFDQGAHMIDLLNAVGIDVMALGNHEFDFGPEILAQRIAEAEFPILSNNAHEPDGSPIDGTQSELVIEVGPYTVGLFGLTTASTAYKSSPGGITFADPVETAAVEAARLREEGAEIVIALAHTDLGEDRRLHEAGIVDLLLSGDDHDLRLEYDGRSATVESGSQAEFVTLIELAIDQEAGRDGPIVTWRPAFEVINTASVEPDPELAARVADYEGRLSKELAIEIGTTETALDTTRRAVRGEETGFANLIADAMRAATGAEVALTNGGGIRADRTYAAGTMLTRRDVLSELPFGNKTILIEVSGADLRAALEHGVGAVEEGAGRFPHVAGLAFAYDPSKPTGARIQEVTVGGLPLELDRTYRLATNDFLGRGGDGYAMLEDAPRIVDDNAGELMASQVIAYIADQGTVAPQVEGRITRID